jgi:gliding motility-associated-like protein
LLSKNEQIFESNTQHLPNMAIYRNTLSNFILFLLFVVIFTEGVAQPTIQWDSTYGGNGNDVFTTALKTNDGGFFLVGSSSSTTGFEVSEPLRDSLDINVLIGDYWMVKIDSFGKKQVDKRFGGKRFDVCHRAIQNTEGYILVGESWSDAGYEKTDNCFGKSDFWIVQVRPDGTKVWDKTFGGTGIDRAYNIVETDNGASYIILGDSDSPPSGNKTSPIQGDKDIWMVKIDKNGNKIWDKTLGSDGKEQEPHALTTTKDGAFIFGCGSYGNASGDKSENNRGGQDVWLVKFDKDGSKIWDRTFGGDLEDPIRDIQELTDGNILVGAYSNSPASGDRKAINYGDYDYWLLKVDKNGNKIWDKSYGGSRNDFMIAIDQNKTGYILLAGQSVSDVSGNKEDSLKQTFDYWLVYVDEDGERVWDYNIGGDGIDAAQDMVKFKDGSYLVCGNSSSDRSYNKSANARGKYASGGNNDDYWAVKISCIFDLNIGNQKLVCKSDTVHLDATIPNCRNCKYNWSTGETTPYIKYLPDTTSVISVKVTATSACVIGDKVKIEVRPSPTVAEYRIQPPRCRDGKDGIIALDSARGGSPPYFLVVNGDTFPRQIFVDNRKAGIYPVALVDREGCRLLKNIEVPNPPLFMLTLPESKEIPFGDSFHLKAASNRPLSSFYWNDRTLRSLDTFVRPFDSYTYVLNATDTLGCQRTASTQVTIRRTNLYFAPNVFSPNGDGLNDYFQIFGNPMVVSIDNLKIFDRWGSLLYKKDRIYPAPESDGWNGTFNGMPMSPGTYVFWAEVTYIDKRKEKIKGDVFLTR